MMKRSLQYLLAFYESDEPLKLKDIAEKLNVKAPSAHEAVMKLVSKGYLIKVQRGVFALSEQGRRYVEELLWRHAVLEWTFMEKLKIKDSRLCEAISEFEEFIPREVIEELCELNEHPNSCPHDIEVPHPGSSKRNKYKYCKA